MRVIPVLLICALILPTDQIWPLLVPIALKGMDLLFGSKDRGSSAQYAGMARAIGAELGQLKQMAASQLEVSFRTDHNIQVMDRKIEQSFDHTLKKLDENAQLVARCSGALAGKMDKVYDNLSNEMGTHFKISHELYSDFRNQTMDMLTYLAVKQEMNQDEILKAHAVLDKLLLSCFSTISEQMYSYHLKQSKTMKEMQEKVLHNLTGISNKQEEIKKRIQSGLEETKKLFAKNEDFLKDMRRVFLKKFEESIAGIRNNAETLQKVRDDIKQLHKSLVEESQDLKQWFAEEIAALWAYLNNNDINKTVIVPINDTFDKMNHYIEYQDQGSKRRFIDAYVSNRIGSMARHILQGFKPWMEAHHRTASHSSNYTYKSFEALRDLLIHNYNLTNKLYVFYEAQMALNQSDYEIMLTQANQFYLNGLGQLLQQEKELRSDVALHEFRVVAHNTLKDQVDQIDDDWDDEEIQENLSIAQRILVSKQWSNSNEPLNDYVLFTTKRCPLSVDLYHGNMEHFLEHTSGNGYRFFLYRYRKDLPKEKFYVGDYEMRNPLMERTFSNVVYDRILSVPLVEPENSSLDVAIQNFRNSSHTAVGELCASQCKVVLTTGRCLVIADGHRKYATMISVFDKVQMFVGF